MPRGHVNTLAEVAERYRFTERWLRDFIRKYNIRVFHTDKQIRFDGLSIAALEEALRRAYYSAPSSEKSARAPIKSPGPSRGSAYERLLNLENLLLRVKKPPRSRPVSPGNNSMDDQDIKPIAHSPKSRKPI
jgi:hypothetical protein